MTIPRTRRKFLKENNKTRKNHHQNSTKKGRGRRGHMGHRGTVGSLQKIIKNKTRYKGGDITDEKIFYVFDNPLLKGEKGEKYDKSILHKFIVNQYNKIKFRDFKEILTNIDEKLDLIKKGRTMEQIIPEKHSLTITSFENEDDKKDAKKDVVDMAVQK